MSHVSSETQNVPEETWSWPSVQRSNNFKILTKYAGHNSIAIPGIHPKMYFDTGIQNTVEKLYRTTEILSRRTSDEVANN